MKGWTYQFTDEARKILRRLDKSTQARIFQSLDRLVSSGAGDVKALKGAHSGTSRLRVGDYRIVFRRDGDRMVILVLDVGNRRDVYRD